MLASKMLPNVKLKIAHMIDADSDFSYENLLCPLPTLEYLKP